MAFRDDTLGHRAERGAVSTRAATAAASVLPQPGERYDPAGEAAFRLAVQQDVQQAARTGPPTRTGTPVALASGDNDDYDIGNVTTLLRLSANSAGSAVTGIAKGFGSRRIVIVNISGNRLTLEHEDTASIAVNRITTSSGLTIYIAQNGAVELIYDDTSTRWRAVPIYRQFDVRAFGATGDGSTDDTAAIQAAIDAATTGTLGIDGAMTLGDGVVIFPTGRYKHTGLSYTGAPWEGEGTHVTTLEYAGDGASVDAVGTNTDRLLLNISDMSIIRVSGATTAYGLRLGFNQRSLHALNNVHIRAFPAHGILFDDNTWTMGFYNVNISFCATTSGAGIGINSAVTSCNALEWYNLILEKNGLHTNTTGGGIELDDTAVLQWAFYGGTWEGNLGAAEARFTNCSSIHISGVYFESSLSATGADNALIFGNGTTASLQGCFLAAVSSHADIAIRAVGTSVLSVDNCWFHPANWAAAISVEGTAKVTLVSPGNLDPTDANHTLQCVAGAVLDQLNSTIFTLADATTIVVVASKANLFNVTLGGNRTMGAPTHSSEGQRITFVITQDGTGGRTLAWNAAFTHAWSDTGNTLGLQSTISFRYQGASWLQEGAQSAYM